MRSRALDVLIAAAAVYLACAIWLVTPWRPLLVASRALGLMRPSLSHVEVSPPRMSPDSTRFAYGLLVQEYSGDRAPVWSFPLDFFEFVRNYEVWVCDLRPGSKPRRVAWWPLRRDQSPFLANWLREGLIVSNTHDWLCAGVLVNPRTGWWHPIYGAPGNEWNEHLFVRHEAVWEENDPRARHVEEHVRRFFLWDPVRRTRTLLFAIPPEHAGLPDPERSGEAEARARDDYKESVQQVTDVRAHTEGDSVVVVITTTAAQPGRARAYDLTSSIEVPDIAHETRYSTGWTYQALPAQRIWLGPTSTTLQRRYALADLANLVRPMCGVTRLLAMPAWSTRFEFGLRPVPSATDTALRLPPGLADGLSYMMREPFDVPLRAEWFHGRPTPR